ncbi:MAG TPA: hypothetical protein VJ736_08085 [Actinomycetota bacterium]|nr:hypothetical protein [Actinomycetota bacterium]
MDEDHTWSRVQHNVLIGAAVGVAIGVVVGVIVGAIAFSRPGAIAASALAGGIGIGVLATFWGLLSGLESPDPGNEPGQVDQPLRDVGELTGEQQPLRHASSDPHLQEDD